LRVAGMPLGAGCHPAAWPKTVQDKRQERLLDLDLVY
jgi:hypothetical protein